jgi:putative DNA primase/helicase
MLLICFRNKCGNTATRSRISTKEDLFSFEYNVNLKKNVDSKVAFMGDICGGDIDKINYLQKVLGYSMIDNMDQRCFFIWYDEGSNGKSVILTLMKKILGKYAVTCSKDLFVASNEKNRHIGAHTAHLVPLIRARFASFSVTEKNVKLNEATIKGITGQDELNVKGIHEKQREFTLVCKFFIHGL